MRSGYGLSSQRGAIAFGRPPYALSISKRPQFFHFSSTSNPLDIILRGHGTLDSQP
jgi:hypothetical protein